MAESALLPEPKQWASNTVASGGPGGKESVASIVAEADSGTEKGC